jgi:predicted secreted hydrolase
MMTGRKILKGALTQLPIELYELMVRSASRPPLTPIAFTATDHFRHRGAHVEWWYFTSVLTTPARTAPIGLEVTFFKVRTLVDSVIVHAAVTDVDGRRFSFTGMVLPIYVRVAHDAHTILGFFGNRLAFDETNHTFLIDTRLRGLHVSISYHVRDVMAQGSNGILAMQNSPGDQSCYFTMPNMTTEGTIVLNGKSLPVSGLTWHDHQWGNFNLVGLKWDWFSLRFDADDLYVMLFNFDRWGTTYGVGNMHSAGTTIRIDRFEVWPSDACHTRNGISYPVDWEVRIFAGHDASVPFMVAHVRPVLKDQSVSSLVTPDYWEGLCVVSAQIMTPVEFDGGNTLEPKSLDGFAYVELTGYER